MSPDDPIDPTADTIPPAANDTELPPPVIPAGFASFEFGRALDRLHAAMLEVEALGAAYARQLDAEVTEAP
jgi:hypothetical protein